MDMTEGEKITQDENITLTKIASFYQNFSCVDGRFYIFSTSDQYSVFIMIARETLFFFFCLLILFFARGFSTLGKGWGWGCYSLILPNHLST